MVNLTELKLAFVPIDFKSETRVSAAKIDTYLSTRPKQCIQFNYSKQFNYTLINLFQLKLTIEDSVLLQIPNFNLVIITLKDTKNPWRKDNLYCYVHESNRLISQSKIEYILIIDSFINYGDKFIDALDQKSVETVRSHLVAPFYNDNQKIYINNAAYDEWWNNNEFASLIKEKTGYRYHESLLPKNEEIINPFLTPSIDKFQFWNSLIYYLIGNKVFNNFFLYLKISGTELLESNSFMDTNLNLFNNNINALKQPNAVFYLPCGFHKEPILEHRNVTNLIQTENLNRYPSYQSVYRNSKIGYNRWTMKYLYIRQSELYKIKSYFNSKVESNGNITLTFYDVFRKRFSITIQGFDGAYHRTYYNSDNKNRSEFTFRIYKKIVIDSAFNLLEFWDGKYYANNNLHPNNNYQPLNYHYSTHTDAASTLTKIRNDRANFGRNADARYAGYIILDPLYLKLIKDYSNSYAHLRYIDLFQQPYKLERNYTKINLNSLTATQKNNLKELVSIYRYNLIIDSFYSNIDNDIYDKDGTLIVAKSFWSSTKWNNLRSILKNHRFEVINKLIPQNKVLDLIITDRNYFNQSAIESPANIFNYIKVKDTNNNVKTLLVIKPNQFNIANNYDYILPKKSVEIIKQSQVDQLDNLINEIEFINNTYQIKIPELLLLETHTITSLLANETYELDNFNVINQSNIQMKSGFGNAYRTRFHNSLNSDLYQDYTFEAKIKYPYLRGAYQEYANFKKNELLARNLQIKNQEESGRFSIQHAQKTLETNKIANGVGNGLGLVSALFGATRNAGFGSVGVGQSINSIVSQHFNNQLAGEKLKFDGQMVLKSAKLAKLQLTNFLLQQKHATDFNLNPNADLLTINRADMPPLHLTHKLPNFEIIKKILHFYNRYGLEVNRHLTFNKTNLTNWKLWFYLQLNDLHNTLSPPTDYPKEFFNDLILKFETGIRIVNDVANFNLANYNYYLYPESSK